MVYRTIITDSSQSSFENTAGIGPISDKGSVNASIDNTFSKENKGFDYNTNILAWQLTVNPIKNGIEGLKVVDDFSADQLMTDTQLSNIIVKKGSSTLSLGSDYSVTKTENNGKIKGFELVLKMT